MVAPCIAFSETFAKNEASTSKRWRDCEGKQPTYRPRELRHLLFDKAIACASATCFVFDENATIN